MKRVAGVAKDIIKLRNSAISQFNAGKSIDSDNFFNGKFQEPDNFSVMMMLDLDYLDQTIDNLKQSFPSHFLHTFACKASPVRVCSSIYLFPICLFILINFITEYSTTSRTKWYGY